MHVSRNTVRTIIAQQGKFSPKQRNDKLQLDAELLGRLVRECDGWIQRVHENSSKRRAYPSRLLTLSSPRARPVGPQRTTVNPL